MNQDQLGKQFTQWTVDIFKCEHDALSYDDLYSTTFFAISKYGAEFVVDSIKIGIISLLEEKMHDLIKKNNDEIIDAFLEFFKNIFLTISRISSVFRPVVLVDPTINFETTLLDQFRASIFQNSELSLKITIFIVSYAHKLPGTLQIEAEKPLIQQLKKFLCGSTQWPKFIDAICESTDAYCLVLSSTMLQDQTVRDNPLLYLGVVLEAIANEQKLWDCLPAQDGDRLRYLMMTSLIYDIKDEYLFEKKSREILERAFFDDFNNFDLFNELTIKVFSDPQILTDLSDMFFDHFGQLIGQIESRQNTVATACSTIEMLINIFERIDILSQTNISLTPAFNERLDGFRKQVLQEPNLNFEFNAARFIGRSIELMCGADATKEKEKEHKNAINQVAKIISYSFKKMEFIDAHNSLMIVRLCQFAGQQYKAEQGVIKILEPYMPPTLSDPFQEKLKAFENSETVNAEWAKTKYGNNLTVFILPNNKAAGISTKFEKVNLPKMFKEWQNAFSNFFSGLQRTKLDLKWVYEENLVIMELKFPHAQFQLKAPLLFAIVLCFLVDHPGATYSQIAQETQLATKEIDIIVGKAAVKGFDLFKITKGQNLDQNNVCFNMNFKTTRKKFSLILNQYFSLKVAQKLTNEAQLIKKRHKMYVKYIVKFMKENNTMPHEALNEAVHDALSASFLFNDKEYNDALSSLTNTGIIKNDAKNLIYIP